MFRRLARGAENTSEVGGLGLWSVELGGEALHDARCLLSIRAMARGSKSTPIGGLTAKNSASDTGKLRAISVENLEYLASHKNFWSFVWGHFFTRESLFFFSLEQW